ncbi:MAG: hypothetical protein KAH84_09895 [Thiomargarita sp.]|nr:hypothetical protein [Thiomargarita sp.]
MGYLDDLKKETQSRKAKEIAIQQQKLKEQNFFDKRTKPALKRLHRYLQDLAQQLKYLEEDATASYKIKGYSHILDDFKQNKYRVLTHQELKFLGSSAHYKKVDKELDKVHFSLLCRCNVPYKFRIRRKDKKEAKLQKRYLEKNSIEFDYIEDMDKEFKFVSALFIVKPIIHVKFDFTSNLEKGVIDLTVTNFNELGIKYYIIRPGEIKDAFLDNLAKYITRQPNKLALREKVTLSPWQEQRLKSKSNPVKKSNSEVIKSVKKENTIPKQSSSKNILTTEKDILEVIKSVKKENTISKKSTPKNISTVEKNIQEFDKWLSSQDQSLDNEEKSEPISKKGKLFGWLKKS